MARYVGVPRTYYLVHIHYMENILLPAMHEMTIIVIRGIDNYYRIRDVHKLIATHDGYECSS